MGVFPGAGNSTKVQSTRKVRRKTLKRQISWSRSIVNNSYFNLDQKQHPQTFPSMLSIACPVKIIHLNRFYSLLSIANGRKSAHNLARILKNNNNVTFMYFQHNDARDSKMDVFLPNGISALCLTRQSFEGACWLQVNTSEDLHVKLEYTIFRYSDINSWCRYKVEFFSQLANYSLFPETMRALF